MHLFLVAALKIATGASIKLFCIQAQAQLVGLVKSEFWPKVSVAKNNTLTIYTMKEYSVSFTPGSSYCKILLQVLYLVIEIFTCKSSQWLLHGHGPQVMLSYMLYLFITLMELSMLY